VSETPQIIGRIFAVDRLGEPLNLRAVAIKFDGKIPKHQCIMLYKTYLDKLNRSVVDHGCERRTDGRNCDSNSDVLLIDAKKERWPRRRHKESMLALCAISHAVLSNLYSSSHMFYVNCRSVTTASVKWWFKVRQQTDALLKLQ